MDRLAHGIRSHSVSIDSEFCVEQLWTELLQSYLLWFLRILQKRIELLLFMNSVRAKTSCASAGRRNRVTQQIHRIENSCRTILNLAFADLLIFGFEKMTKKLLRALFLELLKRNLYLIGGKFRQNILGKNLQILGKIGNRLKKKCNKFTVN